MYTLSIKKMAVFAMFFIGPTCKNCDHALRFARDKKCVECVRLRDRKRNKTEKRHAKDRARYAADPEKRKAHVRKWCVTNPDKKLASDRSWRDRNPDKVRLISSRQYYRDPAKAHAAVNAWALRNPEKAAAAKQKADRDKRARKRGAKGSHTPAEILNLFKQQDGQCFYCAELLTTFHEDHFIPLSRNGSNDIANIRLACEPCNLKKHAKLPRDFFIKFFAL